MGYKKTIRLSSIYQVGFRNTMIKSNTRLLFLKDTNPKQEVLVDNLTTFFIEEVPEKLTGYLLQFSTCSLNGIFPTNHLSIQNTHFSWAV